MEIYRSLDGSEVAIVAATWEINRKITFDSLASEFERNPTTAWRNYGSVISKTGIEAAVKRPELIALHCNTRRESPWSPARNDGRGSLKQWFQGVPGVNYYVHFDLSLRRDATGVAMVHREKDGIIRVDFMLRVVVPPNEDINFADLRQFVYDFSSRGFRVRKVTYDQFQSEETRQILTEKGYETGRESADKDLLAYTTLIELMLVEPPRIDYYMYEPFLEEMEDLKLVKGRKYDHPKKSRFGKKMGSKDVTDAVACATVSAIKCEMDDPEHPSVIRVHRSHYGQLHKIFEDRGQF